VEYSLVSQTIVATLNIFSPANSSSIYIYIYIYIYTHTHIHTLSLSRAYAPPTHTHIHTPYTPYTHTYHEIAVLNIVEGEVHTLQETARTPLTTTLQQCGDRSESDQQSGEENGRQFGQNICAFAHVLAKLVTGDKRAFSQSVHPFHVVVSLR
jgi:hypothetical protein